MPGREVLYETFFTRAPGQDKLRKSASGRMKHLLREGWHEVSRQEAGPDSFTVRFEREGVTKPLPPLRTKPEPPPRRPPRGDRRGGPGGRGGPGAGPPGGGGAPPRT
jgi:hypothetical protein